MELGQARRVVRHIEKQRQCELLGRRILRHGLSTHVVKHGVRLSSLSAGVGRGGHLFYRFQRLHGARLGGANESFVVEIAQVKEPWDSTAFLQSCMQTRGQRRFQTWQDVGLDFLPQFFLRFALGMLIGGGVLGSDGLQ